MLNKFNWVILFSTLTLIMTPIPCFAWHSDGSGHWSYYGSGRDYPYSKYIDTYYSPGYADYSTLAPGYFDDVNVPASAMQLSQVPAIPSPDQFTVNIPNDHGGYTAVIIKRLGSGFVGPQGEYYSEFPKISQLKTMYGKN